VTESVFWGEGGFQAVRLSVADDEAATRAVRGGMLLLLMMIFVFVERRGFVVFFCLLTRDSWRQFLAVVFAVLRKVFLGWRVWTRCYSSFLTVGD
jgi:hypothetical protein